MFTRDKVDISGEIRRVVALAMKDGGSVHAERSALRIAEAYPNSRLSIAQLAERIIEAALAARLPLRRSTREFSTAFPGYGASKLIGG